MQPHSMSTLGLVSFIWNNPWKEVKNSASAEIMYRKRADELVTNYYDLSNISQSSDKTYLRVTVVRSGQGNPCTMNIRRSTAEVPSKVSMEHEQQHRAGFSEEFRLTQTEIKEGKHYNSLLYNNFTGSFIVDDCSRAILNCQVKNRDGVFVWVEYRVKVDFR